MNKALNSTIDSKLMCASCSAYFVNMKGNFIAPAKTNANYCLYNNLDIQGKVMAFSNTSVLLDKIDAAILFETTTEYILAFRGTLPFSLKGHDLALLEDWGEDVLGSDTVVGKGLPGLVHEGFYDAFTTIWPKINKQLKKIYSSKSKASKPLYVTGHSKGGPMASYGAYMAKAAGFPMAGVTTFASPFAGNADFANAYNQSLTQTRYEYYLDLVPFLPPQSDVIKNWKTDIDLLMVALEIIYPKYRTKFQSIIHFMSILSKLNYQPVGQLKYINKSFNVVNDSPGLHAKRIAEFKAIIEQDGYIDGIKRIGKSHSIGCGGGYQKGACPGVCPMSEV